LLRNNIAGTLKSVGQVVEATELEFLAGKELELELVDLGLDRSWDSLETGRNVLSVPAGNEVGDLVVAG
jgi:hypothetical protein